MAELFDFNTIVTLLVLLWVIIGFLSGKWSAGLVAITGLVVLELTGVLTFKEAFAYASSTNVIMIAAMFVLSAALQKTSLVSRLRTWMLSHAKSGRTVVFMYLIACILMVNFVMPTALISMLLPFMNALDEDSEVQPSHLLFPGAIMGHAGQNSLPLGMALTAFVQQNVMLEANGAAGTLGPFSNIIVCLPSMIVLLIYYTFIGWKLHPAKTMDTSRIKEYKEKEVTIPKWQETLIYVIFIGTMAIVVLNSLVKDFPIDMYIAPVIGVIILAFAKVMNSREIASSMNIPTVLMFIGVLPLATAMQKSNASQIVAQTIVNILGGNPSYPVFLFAFMLVGGILTQFMSNSATNNVFRPLAIITAVSLGYNAAGVCVAVGLMTNSAMLTPMASPSLAIAYGAGHYTQSEILKANFPAFILKLVTVFAATLIFYPAAG